MLNRNIFFNYQFYSLHYGYKYLNYHVKMTLVSYESVSYMCNIGNLLIGFL